MKKLALALALATALTGCTTDPYTGQPKLSNTVGGAGIGAGLGAGAGYLIGRAAGIDAGRAALVGAGIGVLSGGAVGAYMDDQEAKLRAQLQGTGVSVTRAGDRIILNMPSNITFPTDQASILPAFYPTLNSVALVLQEYDRSIVDVYGHTDSAGLGCLQPAALAGARRLGQRLPGEPGRQSAPAEHPGIRREPAGRHERNGSRARAEPPRRDRDLAAHLRLISDERTSRAAASRDAAALCPIAICRCGGGLPMAPVSSGGRRNHPQPHRRRRRSPHRRCRQPHCR